MKNEITSKIYGKTISDYNKTAADFARSRKKSVIWHDLKGIERYYESGKKILDLGCGNGDLIRLVNPSKDDYLGIDASSELIKIARADFPDFDFKVADYLNLNFRSGQFDVIYWIAGIHHIHSYKLRLKILKKIKELLVNNGYLILSCRNVWRKPFLKYLFINILKKITGQSRLDFFDAYISEKKYGGNIERYTHFFTKRELKKLLWETGFKILELKKTKKNYIVIAKK